MVAINPSDIAIIIIVALVLFVGSSKIPELFLDPWGERLESLRKEEWRLKWN